MHICMHVPGCLCTSVCMYLGVCVMCMSVYLYLGAFMAPFERCLESLMNAAVLLVIMSYASVCVVYAYISFKKFLIAACEMLKLHYQCNQTT